MPRANGGRLFSTVSQSYDVSDQHVDHVANEACRGGTNGALQSGRLVLETVPDVLPTPRTTGERLFSTVSQRYAVIFIGCAFLFDAF